MLNNINQNDVKNVVHMLSSDVVKQRPTKMLFNFELQKSQSTKVAKMLWYNSKRKIHK